jgi:hypothetical protein
MKKEAQAGYVRMLSPYPFQWFCTFTFKTETHPEAADKLFRVWLNILNRTIFGKRWRERAPGGVIWVRALEWQRRGVIHYHALILGLPGNQSLELAQHFQSVWREEMGVGFSRIDLIKHGTQEAVSNYVSKYVTKDGELDFSQNFSESNIPKLPSHDLLGAGGV